MAVKLLRLVPLILGTGMLAVLNAAAQGTRINGVAVLVNDVPITFKEIEDETIERELLVDYQYDRQPQLRDQKIAELRRDALEGLVERQLMLQEFKNAGYQMPQSIIDDHIKATIRERFGDRVRMIKTLAEQGITYEAYRKRIQDEFIIYQMLFKNVGKEVLISPHKIEQYYQEHLDEFKAEDMLKLRMIFLAIKPERDAESTRKLAESIHEKLEAGESFADLAKVRSDDSYRAEGGLRKEPIYRKTLREDLAEAAFALDPGQRSPVIESPEGCYLMLVEERKPAHTRTLNEVRDEIEGILQRQEQQRARKQWIQRLKEKAFIRYFPAG